jgi:hypothetical protein
MKDGAVVFRGRRQVVEAYISNDMGPWAIVHGKDLMFADESMTVDEGQQSLTTTLDRLHEGMSKAIFQLRVYKLKKGEEIMSNTPHARAFPFRLYSEEDPSPFDMARVVVDRQAQAEIDALKAQIRELQEQLNAEEEEEEMSPVNRMISGVMEMPGIKDILQQKLIGFINNIIPMNGNNRPAAVAGVGNPQPGQVILEPGQIEKISQAINVLSTKDPLLGDHLLGVARIASENPGKYNMLVGML